MRNIAREQPEFIPAKNPTETNATDPFQQAMTQVEALTHELNKLLINHEQALEKEGIRHEVETLGRWLETYRHGLSAAHKISENSIYWLFTFRNKLQLAASELQRLEEEGGGVSSANGKQIQEAEELLKVICRIDEILPNIQHLFCEDEEGKHCLT